MQVQQHHARLLRGLRMCAGRRLVRPNAQARSSMVLAAAVECLTRLQSPITSTSVNFMWSVKVQKSARGAV